MKILALAPLVPYPLNRGTHQRVFHFLQALGQKHELSVLMLDPEGVAHEYMSVFRAFSADVRYIPVRLNPWRPLWQRLASPLPETMHHWALKNVQRAIGDLLQRQRFDLIYCEDICMTQYLLDLPLDIPVVTDRNRVDIEFMQEQRPFIEGWRQQLHFEENRWKLQRFERQVLQRFPRQIVCSAEDRDFLVQHYQAREIAVVGNGFDAGYFQPQVWENPSDIPVFCFTGAMDYQPNIDGLHWFMQQVYPLLKQRLSAFKLRVVGLNPLPEVQAYGRFSEVEVTGGVPDIRPAYAACDVYLAPIRIGGGTRLKILEAMAMQKPVVSTTTGAQGLGLTHGVNVRFGDSPEAFAAEILALVQQPQLRQALAAAGRAHVLRHFTWTQLGAELCQYLEGQPLYPAARAA